MLQVVKLQFQYRDLPTETVDVTDSITVEDVKVVRFPTFISPIDNRAQGGGYQKFDLDNPDTVKELCRQASRELNAWIKDMKSICTLKILTLIHCQRLLTH